MADRTVADTPKYFLRSCQAIAERQYKQAARTLERGIRQNLKVPEDVDAAGVLLGVESVLQCLCIALNEDFGLRWLAADRPQAKQDVRCSFCGRTQKEVVKVVAGPGCYICDRCSVICYELATTPTRPNRPTKRPVAKRRK